MTLAAARAALPVLSRTIALSVARLAIPRRATLAIPLIP
jgi:hypothetical protein